MAIIYSYEQEANPQFSDLLLGTDVSAPGKPTKSFSIQSIVDLVETGVPGGGTVTSVGTNSSTFVTLSGGPITTSGIISASLSATGTPSATTYLRGDNTWATIPSSLNTTYTITSAQNGTAANIRLTGSDTTQTLVTLAAGANIALTDNGSNRITIGVTGLPSGSVTSVTADGGLYIVSGSATVNPVLAVDLTGLNNYIKISQNQTTAISDDFIAFNQNSSENVKTTTLGAITPNSLSLVKDYIDAGDVGDVRNDTDTFTTTAVVENVVSLTSAEYSALTPNQNTLYLIVGAATSYTNTLAFTNNIVGTEYTIGGDQSDATRSGIEGASYSFNTTITPNSGYYFSSGPTVTNASGVFGNANQTVYTILGGTVEQIVEPPITATLSVSTSGVSGTQFTLGGDLAGATQSGPAPLSYAFNTTISANSGYEFVTGPTVSNASGTLNGSQTVVTTITGELQAVAPPQVTVTPSLINNFTGESSQVSLSVTPGSFSGDSPVAYSFTPSATANSGYAIQNLSFTGDISGSATSSKTAVMYANGNIIEEEIGAIVELDLVINISGGGYVTTGDLDGAQQSGPLPFTYAFDTEVSPLPGYEFINGGPEITNASGTTNQAGLQYVTTTITGTIQAVPENPKATLSVTYNITGDNVWTPAGNLSGTQQSGPSPFFYNFDTYANGTPTITIPATYQFDVAPSTSPSPITPAQGITTDTTVPVTVSATISEIPVLYYTLFKCSTQSSGFTSSQTTAQISLNNNDQIYDLSNTSETYIVTGTSASQGTSISVSSVQGTNCPPTLYYYIIENCANSAQLQYGYSQQPNLGAGDTFNYQSNCYKYYDVDPTAVGTINLDVLSTCQCGCEEGTVNLTFSNNVTGAANTTAALSGFTSITGCVGDPYTFTNSIVASAGYQFTSGPTWNPSAVITGTITSGTTNVTQTVTGNVTAIPDEVTVTLAFSNNVTNNQFTTTSLTPGATITGNPGDSYQFVHTITTDPGYEFTSGPTWVDNVSNNGTGTINGTIPNSNTTITQSVSGVVESSATCTSFAAGPNSNLSGVCEAIGLNTYYHNGAGSYPVAGDIVYSESGCSTFLAAGYYLMSSNNYIRVVAGGEVLQVGNCV